MLNGYKSTDVPKVPWSEDLYFECAMLRRFYRPKVFVSKNPHSGSVTWLPMFRKSFSPMDEQTV